METTPKEKIGRFRSLAIRNYRLYFIGQAISLCGTWMQTIAQDWLVLKITGSGTQLGIVSAFQFLPILILGPLGGVIADRFDKRKILYATQTFAGILALILGILVATNTVHIWMIYVLALGLGLSSATDYPARQTFVSEMVGNELLSNAIALNSTEVNLARAIGPAIAGLLITLVGIAPCFIINGLSYIAVIIVLSRMRKSELKPAPRSQRMKGQLKAGFQYVKNSPFLLYTLLMMAIIGTFSYEFSVSLPLLAQSSFHGGAGTYSALVAATGVGSVIGGLYATGRKKANGKMLVFFAFTFGVSFTLVAFMPNVISAIIMLLIVGMSSINFISLGSTLLQLESEPQMRGRVMSLWTMAFLGSTPIGGPIIGWLGEHAGPRSGVLTGGIAAIFAAGIGAMTLSRIKKPVLEGPINGTIQREDNELDIEDDAKMR